METLEQTPPTGQKMSLNKPSSRDYQPHLPQLAHSVDMVCQEEPLVRKVCDLYNQISNLENLKPCKDVDMLFTQLVLTCMQPSSVDVAKLCTRVQQVRAKLIQLCAQAEGLLESHFSTILASFKNPLQKLDLFPYYQNYLKLSLVEFNILSDHCQNPPSKLAFIGSGSLPLTSIVLALNHLPSTIFHNYDIDPFANSNASSLISSHPDLSKRMFFHTADIMNVSHGLKEYQVVFLAALVGMNKEEKAKVVDHLCKFMAPGAYLMVRSAHGARAFLYPVVDFGDLRGFEILSVFHPTDEVINSVIIARKKTITVDRLDDQGNKSMVMPCKCSEMQTFSIQKMEEVAMEGQLS